MSKTLLGLIAALLALLLFAVVGFGVYFATREPADPLSVMAREAKRQRREEDAKEPVAREQAKRIASACERFYVKNQEFPQSLAVLTVADENGSPPLLGRDEALDPWGRPFQYDPSGPNNGGNRPDVWTTTPLGKTVGNW